MASRKKKAETPKAAADTPAEDGTESVQEGDAPQATEDILDAEIIEESPPEPEPDAEPEPEPKAADEPAPDQEPEPEETPLEDLTETEPDSAQDAPPPESVPQPQPVVVRKGGFVPMLLGGVAAAAIGFGAALVAFPGGLPWSGAQDQFQQDVTARLDAQTTALTEVKQTLAKAPDIAAELAPVKAQLGAARTGLETLAVDLSDATKRLDGIETRLSDLEKRPMTEAISPEAVKAYEDEMKALQQAVSAQRAEIEKLAAEAVQKEASAEQTAQQAETRAAVSRILAALDAGTGFSDAAQTLGAAGVALPPVLTQVADAGVATRADLVESFPDAARAALAKARKTRDGGGLSGFLKTQLGARSLEPREGNDPDAVLSRAEAAVKDGRLGDAIAEIEALPEPARAEMSDWLTRATRRRDAVAAAEKLAADLN